MRVLTMNEVSLVSGSGVVESATTGGVIGTAIGAGVTGSLAGASAYGVIGVALGFSWGVGYSLGSAIYRAISE